MTTIIDGKKTAHEVRTEVADDVASHIATGRPAPALATILVGDDPVSVVYVANKRRSVREAGKHDVHRSLPQTQHRIRSPPASTNSPPTRTSPESSSSSRSPGTWTPPP